MEVIRQILHKVNGLLLATALVVAPMFLSAQFYHGMHQPFGKNRVQHESFDWQKFEFNDFTVFFYGKGRNLAEFTAKNADQMISDVERFYDYPVRSERLQFVVYQKLEHFRQSNVGIPETDESNIGGRTQIAGNKIFVYYNGDLNDLKRQVRKGVSEVLIAQMLFGDNWREMIKNNALLNFPDWYIDGLTWYSTQPWSVEADDQLRDLVLRNKYKNFSHLKGEDAEIAGRSLWYYIGETYGSKVIPNIIYMARISRNVESGFMFVLGISMNTLLQDAESYFRHRYKTDLEGTQELNEFMKVRTSKHKDYTELKISDDGKYLAYVSNVMSKTKVHICDLEREKRKTFLRQGHKLDRVNDLSYPVMDWNAATGMLTVITEKRGKLWMYQIHPKKGIDFKTEILRLEKVMEMEVSQDGKSILFSAINKGQTDIYLYSVAARNQKQLTNDVFDDRYPTFWGDQVLFSSNRTTDTVNIGKSHLGRKLAKNFDLYSLSLEDGSEVTTRMTKTPLANERHPVARNQQQFLYLSDASGISNRYLGQLDSTIQSIDTTITYRYFTRSTPLSSLPRGIREWDYNESTGTGYQLIQYEGKHRFMEVEDAASASMLEPPTSAFVMAGEPGDGDDGSASISDTSGIQLIQHKVFEEDTKPTAPGTEVIDFDNYEFDEEAIADSQQPTTPDYMSKEDSISLNKQFAIPEQRNYNLAFAATDLTTQFDFDYATDLYQPFNGGPYIMPGMGTFIRVGMLDVFEDYKLEGGFRYSFNSSGTEYYISLEDRSKRLDKKYIAQRQSLANTARTDSIQRTYLYQVRGIFRYPVDEVHSLQFTATGRYDRKVTEAIEGGSLREPDRYVYYAGVKAEYIFDNTLFKSLNILNGSRMKVFGEHYRDVINPNSGFSVVGLDARNYQKIHRDLIWANRVAGSSSFGQRKLVYYMGSVDNWIVLSNRDRFDRTTNVPGDQGYAFQTIATNMRGFIQNARNGNNFVVFNSEIRWPVVKYFTDKPIKSDFLANFQVMGFADVGTAWNGPNPYSDENAFNNITVTNGAVKVTYKNQNDPIIGGVGWGLRTKIWGYFVRYDYAWGIENGLFLDPINYLSFGLDF